MADVLDGARWRVIQGDCLDVLKTLPDGCFDCVVCDPPYGIGFKSNGQWFKGASPIAGDTDTSIAEAVAEMCSGMPLVMFYSPYRPLNIAWRSVLIWAKGKHVGIGGDRETCWMRDFEMIGVRDNKPLNGKRDSAILTYRALLPPPTGHFAEKPLDLMSYLIEKIAQPDDLVLDPFCGSGTTGVAALRTGRRFLGIEISEQYAAISRRRLEAEAATPMLDGMAGIR